ncbi:DUF6457 domain-containing protein [Aeromicrobium sp. UC242_57]|uniref:DUF6457 domain-containing protein n=1 Tax=Aeromicrobium sp. UC242_57 TaxID=3374624 RepID=UPI00379B6541
MDDDVLTRWAAGLATDLGIEQILDVDVVLKVAADAAHGVIRPAAPLTTFWSGWRSGRLEAIPPRSPRCWRPSRTRSTAGTASKFSQLPQWCRARSVTRC